MSDYKRHKWSRPGGVWTCIDCQARGGTGESPYRDDDYACPPGTGPARIRELEAEVERLREHLSKCNDAGRKFHTQRDEARAEVERLRNEWVPDVAYGKVYDDRDEAVRLLRKLTHAYQVRCMDGPELDAAEKYLEGKAGAS